MGNLIKPVRGNWFKLVQPLEKIKWESSEGTAVDYEPAVGDTLKVELVGAYNHYNMEKVQIELNPENNKRNLLTYENNGTLPLGLYDIEISVTLADGKRLHSCQPKRVKIVKTNSEASIPDYVEFGIETFTLQGELFMYVPTGEDGVGIDSITTVESPDDGGNNVVTIHLTDGTQSSFNVKNGHKGSDGAQGPQGQQGPQGAQGEKGETGEQGPQGPAGQNGTNGTNGTNGSDGKSAYEIAVENGFVGDETAWLASLKGEQGIQGPTGPQGPAGTSPTLNYDNVPTNNSSNLLTSGTVFTALQGKEDKVAIITPTLSNNAFDATVGNYYKVTFSSAITIQLDTPDDTTKLSSCIFLITGSSGSVTFSAETGVTVYYSKGWDITPGKVYEVNALYNGTAWYLTQVEMEVQP